MWYNTRMATRTIFGIILVGAAVSAAAATHDVRAFGAKGDGRTKDTAAIQRALDACAGTGGRVVVPPGTYLIGSIFLGDATELHLEKDATLLGSPDLADYNAPDAYPQNFGSVNEGWSAKHLVLAIEKKGVSITGRGVIDGNGRAFFGDKPLWRGKVGWRDGAINARDWKHQGRPGQEIVFIECRDVSVRDVTLRDMSCWSCFFHGCENVVVGGVTIRNGLLNLNTDGIDVDSCRNVQVGDCDIETGDDAVTIRGCPAKLKDSAKVCENIRFSNIVCRVSADGIRVGVGDGTIRNAHVSDMRIEHSGRGLHVQCCYGKNPRKGVDISGVKFERITIRDTAQAILVGAGSPHSKAKLGNISFDRIDAESELPVTVAGGGETRVHGVSFANCKFRPVRSREGQVVDREAGKLSGGNDGAIRIEQADGVSFRDCTLRWDGDADPGITRAFSVHDAEAPSVDASSILADRR